MAVTCDLCRRVHLVKPDDGRQSWAPERVTRAPHRTTTRGMRALEICQSVRAIEVALIDRPLAQRTEAVLVELVLGLSSGPWPLHALDWQCGSGRLALGGS